MRKLGDKLRVSILVLTVCMTDPMFNDKRKNGLKQQSQ